MEEQTGSTRRDALKKAGTAGLIGLSGCLGGGGGESPSGEEETDSATPTASPTVSAAWMYNTSVGDLGWTYAHHQGLKAVEEQFDWLDTTIAEEVNPDDARNIAENFAQQGVDVVFGTSFGFMNGMVEAAENYPDTIFEHCSGFQTRQNMGRYFGRLYQSYYLTGVAAGMVTETDVLGFVGAFPIPEVVRFINAFTLGAAQTNDNISTKVRWVNAWFDPPKAKEATNALADADADVIATIMDSPASTKAAAENEIWATGVNSPLKQFGGDYYLTAPIWDWSVFYEPEVQSVKDGTWESDFYWKGLNSGIVDLDEWGPQVPQNVKDTVAEEREAIESGSKTVWDGSKFEGESDTFLFSEMITYVPQVVGEVPS